MFIDKDLSYECIVDASCRHLDDDPATPAARVKDGHHPGRHLKEKLIYCISLILCLMMKKQDGRICLKLKRSLWEKSILSQPGERVQVHPPRAIIRKMANK